MSPADDTGDPPGAGARPTAVQRLWSRHALAVAILFPVAACAVVFVRTAGTTFEVAALLVAVVLGLPHGALDGRVGKRLFAPVHGRLWLVPFLAVYLALFAATMVSWQLAPVLALPCFLAISIVHFGACDRDPASRFPRLAVLAHGGLPIVLPALAQPAAVEQLFTWLAGNGAATAVLHSLTGPVAAAWLAALAVTITSAFPFAPLSGTGATGKGRHLAAMGATGLLFVLAPPAIAFALYFALLHTPRALLETLGTDEADPLAAAVGAVREAVPLSIAALGIGGLVFLIQPAGDWAPAAVRTVFQVLSALTVPHMWLEYRASAAVPNAPHAVLRPRFVRRVTPPTSLARLSARAGASVGGGGVVKQPSGSASRLKADGKVEMT